MDVVQPNEVWQNVQWFIRFRHSDWWIEDKRTRLTLASTDDGRCVVHLHLLDGCRPIVEVVVNNETVFVQWITEKTCEKTVRSVYHGYLPEYKEGL